MSEDPANKYKLVVGTDSHTNGVNGGGSGNKKVDFITALVIHKIGHGGKYFWHKEKTGKIKTLRQKIYQETYLSLGLAQTLMEHIQNSLANKRQSYDPKFELEIHVDIGENGQTREMLKEIVGLVRGNGFYPKTKPNSFGASNVADKHT